MDPDDTNTEKPSFDGGSTSNTNQDTTGNSDPDILQWNPDDFETHSNGEESCDEDGEESDYSSTDSDGFSEKCPICLQRFSGQEIGTPETCEHYFCLECITKWSNKTATCPVDRKSFPSILVRRDLEGEVVRIQEVVFQNQNPNPEGEQYDFDPTYCEICGLCDREDRLLLCDGCDLGYHLECLEPRLEYVPIEDWFCPRCQATHRAPEAAPTSSREASHRSVRVARTSQSIRILHSIARSTTSDLVMETSAMEELGMRRSAPSSRNSSRSTGRRRKQIRKKPKSKSKSAKRKTRSSGRTASEKRPSSIRRRLLQQLRIIPPRPGQVYVGLPNCRGNANSANTSASSSTSSLSSQRFHAGITPLRLYDSYDDLESYDNSGDEVANGEVGIAATVRPRIGLPMRNKSRPPRDIAPPASLSGRVDILGPILNRQFILHQDRNIHIARDGTLVPSLPVNAANLHFQKTLASRKLDATETNNNISGTKNNNSGTSSSSSPLRNGHDSVDRNSRSPFNNHPGHFPSTGLNEYARQAPSSPNGTNSSTNAAGPSFINERSTENTRGSGQPSSAAVFDGSSAHSVPPWENDSNSRNDSDPFAASNNIFPQLCKSSTTGDPKPKSDDESHTKDTKANSKRQPNSKTFTDSRHNDDDDEDYNIYSDIEEVPEEIILEKKTKRNASQDHDSEIEINRDREKDSDSEMVIDEENAKIRRTSLDKEGQLKCNNSSIGKTSEPEWSSSISNAPEIALPPADLAEYNLPSPESIPLPDSPPPFESGSTETETESPSLQSPFFKVRNDILDSAGKGKSALREEYDPSQPLDSSDEEEHSMQLTQRSSFSDAEENEIEKEEEEIPIPASPSEIPAEMILKPPREVDDDLNSIPMPPTEDYRRPTIQFSIPTRHRLLPISSLIKRQKGVMRKESKNGNPMSFQSEISKIFGDEKGEESGGDWTKLGDSPEEKLSLVAEIFGSDDEEGEGMPENGPGVAIPSMANALHGAQSIEEDISKGERVNASELEKLNESTSSSIPTVANSRWKTIAEPTLVIPSGVASSEGNHVMDEEEEPIKEMLSDTPEVEVVAVKEPEVVVISNITKVKLKDRESHYHSKNSESPSRKESPAEDIDNGTGDKSNSSLESISDEDSFDSDSSAHRNGEGGRARRRRDPANGKSHKRKRSHSLTSNCEEGEIVDVPEKKKKKGKKKKSKKRKKSKESRSPSVINFTEKKPPDSQARHSSSDEMEDGSKPVSWRKPSKSTKQRNYRDGKPKAEEKYFRENDKHRDGSPRERRERDKHPKEKSPVRESKRERSKERTESRKTPDDSRNHNSSRSKSHRWRSRSRSVSKSRKDKHYSSPSGKKTYSSRSESRNSPLRHSRRHRRSKSPTRTVHSRSHSRSSGKYRSHSPLGKSSRRRSRSDSRSRRNKRRRSATSSSSRSISSKRSKGRRKDKFGADDRLKRRKDRERDKDKDREKEKEKEKEKEREKVVEVRETKDKKKKRKRREKSVSPVKAIVADGDSIVVSLNFQKGKESASASNAESTNTSKNDDTSKRKSSKSKNGRSGDKDSSKPKLLKKTVLIDLEASPIQEQNIGVSPTVIVLSDDDECVDSQSKEKDPNDKHPEEKSTSGAVTNSVGGASAEPGERCSPYRHGHGVAADSTQVQPQSSCKIGEISFSASMSTSGSPDEGSNGSLMRDDSVVTSTRGSVETAHPPDEESMNSCSPTSKTPLKGKLATAFQPVSPKATPPLALNSPPTYSMRSETASTPSSATTPHKANGQVLPATSTPIGMAGKPVIGNIPGLFPSKTAAMSGGNVSIPSPIVIPTPPTPQLRFPAMNPTLLNSNVLVSVASAIYGPFLAARQQSSAVRNIQPNQMAANTLGNVIANKNNLQGSVLLPKNQNFHTFNSRTNNIATQPTGDGDSPFSPNSSEGDDLFEPPNERGQLDSVSSSKNDKSSSANSAPTPTSGHIPGGISAPGGKVKSNLFDSLFGASPNKSVHNKMQDRIGKIKTGSHQKSKGHRQTVKKEVKLSEGELRLSEDVPTSAVELRVKEKFLKKLNRQERVVEEVKLSLKPHYSKKHITKDEYKEILRKAVPKICHNKSGEINPNKIKELVEAYVKKFRHSRKKE